MDIWIYGYGYVIKDIHRQSDITLVMSLFIKDHYSAKISPQIILIIPKQVLTFESFHDVYQEILPYFYPCLEEQNKNLEQQSAYLKGQFSFRTSMSQFKSFCVVINLHLVSWL